jgi:hypothetical protein
MGASAGGSASFGLSTGLSLCFISSSAVVLHGIGAYQEVSRALKIAC